MFYDEDAVEIIRNDETQEWIVLYQGVEVGTVDNYEDAHYLLVDYSVGLADMRNGEER